VVFALLSSRFCPRPCRQAQLTGLTWLAAASSCRGDGILLHNAMPRCILHCGAQAQYDLSINLCATVASALAVTAHRYMKKFELYCGCLSSHSLTCHDVQSVRPARLAEASLRRGNKCLVCGGADACSRVHPPALARRRAARQRRAALISLRSSLRITPVELAGDKRTICATQTIVCCCASISACVRLEWRTRPAPVSAVEALVAAALSAQFRDQRRRRAMSDARAVRCCCSAHKFHALVSLAMRTKQQSSHCAAPDERGAHHHVNKTNQYQIVAIVRCG
jgi:hypothetical protein